MIILGINAYHGDAAAAIVRDGQLVAAAEEERFNRHKHCAGFPAEAIRYCLKDAGVEISDVDHIGISRDPSAHLHKKILFAATRAAKNLTSFDRAKTPSAATKTRGLFNAVAERLANTAKVRDLRDDLARQLGVARAALRAEFHNVEHHHAHLASAFFVSPFERAALLSIDGFGDFISTMWGVGDGNAIDVLGQVEYPHSTGIVYTATTQFLGFPHYGDEGKVMGLAPYGRPRYMEAFRDIIRTEEGGRFTLNLDYFRHHAEGVDMTWDDGSPTIGRIFSDEYAKCFGPPREPGAALTEREQDIATSLQLRLEEVGFHILNHLYETTGLTDLGLAGGVAYNSVMNGKILLNTPFRRVYVQPAAGDSGTAIGVCYQIYNGKLGGQRMEVMEGAYTGPEFSDQEIRAELERAGLRYESFDDREVTRRAARDIADGAVMGWFQGRMEFGPRALGNRSIVVDPRRADMKEILNERIKKREPFRPFAPSILEECVGDYFEQTHPAPTMLMVYQIKPERRAEIPAVTHVDGSGRLQTVSRAVNPRYYQLIADFRELTGIPVVLNTSFNENEPIVCTPRHAIDCFLKTRMDVLYLGNHAVRRA
ncbi:MAG TPA: carbamoyltransferase C-terminal domain-containing protein [Blastocatellia bacterium]|nr:carbamoyltransferase C-terminal domain-containing protein [Blastocatellia bacterium]